MGKNRAKLGHLADGNNTNFVRAMDMVANAVNSWLTQSVHFHSSQEHCLVLRSEDQSTIHDISPCKIVILYFWHTIINPLYHYYSMSQCTHWKFEVYACHTVQNKMWK